MRDPMTADLRARVARIVDGLDDAACAMTWGTFARPRDPNIVLNLDPFLSVADIKAILAALDAADREREATLDRFTAEALDDDACADLLRTLVNAGRNGVRLPTALVYWPPVEHLLGLAARPQPEGRADGE